MKPSSPANAALHIGLFSFMIVGLVTLVFHATKDKIANNERQALISSLQTVLPQDSYDNDLLNDVIKIQPYTIYRARKTNQPIAAIFISTTPHGYNGDIRLLIGINIDGKITAIRVLKHKETPGLGDKIEIKKSDWVLGFKHKSLSDMSSAQWAVKQDGGSFDQFTGATITPRAIVNEVKKTGLFFQQNQQVIFQ
ncbi:electron transport complex protein RnfG [Bathymodiolus platifrons methanotrophic gill symbiont]|uniref:electron transport complex subunit RsxG n=1 Tax=Bathymodiolus platifrons methanotrophic gill symbiont TaxID=113268 RepID=UPI0011C8ED70|nr:electron transport complex subunit RsxG [Bathymodiolus platifrons methanotrophic gill symbiont]MCK5869874.1 electron transport complex subunit RsxG [Methyloprofundus sp.]TXK94011.1 electron transport complex subunit RsxG [Methylococcaceae bacterium CS4]TXK94254.1 electron transport complex subunit RsxG [Methylococcaceae bacterium CS5]TXL02004.1 electron transport complex subunit RsxG [Methylococcaceae bacterium HT1]TXL04351.1 electron transport complex subunit RsxG [Methylococcaceae bacteri